MTRWTQYTCVLIFFFILCGVGISQNFEKGSSFPKVPFARDILPILSTHCFVCHGQDEKARKAGLRLDIAEVATRKLKSGSIAVVPGDPKASELIARIYSRRTIRNACRRPRATKDSKMPRRTC